MDHRQRSFTKLRKTNIAEKMNFLIMDFFSKCDQIRSFLRIWSHLLKKSSMENFYVQWKQLSFPLKSVEIHKYVLMISGGSDVNRLAHI